MCADCRVSTPVGFKCRACAGTDSPGPARRDGDRTGRTRLLVAVGIGVVVVLVVAGALYAVNRGGSGSNGPTAARLQPGTRGTDTPNELSIEFQGAGGLTLGGNLLLPPGANAKTPAVVIVPDDGPTDRNGISPANALADPLYSDLAQVLAQQGVASLRYDRRGRGQSMTAAGSSVTLPDVVGDAKAAVGFLAGRADLDRSRLGVIGDGQGGLVALEMAAQDPAVRAVVLVSTPGRPVPASLSDELTAQAGTPEFGQQLVSQLQAVVTSLSAGAAEPAPAQLPGPLQPLLGPGEGPYLRSIFALSPPAVAQMVHVPMLITQGGSDPALSPADAQALAQGAGPEAQVMLVPADGATLNGSAGPAVPPSPTASTPTTAAGIQGMAPSHSPNQTVTTVRDDQTLTSMGMWLKTHVP